MAELQEQIEAVGKESQRQIELADKRKMLKSELRRLEDENSMQRSRITQMEHDLKVVSHWCTAVVSNNPPEANVTVMICWIVVIMSTMDMHLCVNTKYYVALRGPG